MKCIVFDGANLILKPPKDWNEELNGPCETIAAFQGGGRIVTVWEPTDEERTAIAAGQNIVLSTLGRGFAPTMMEIRDIKPIEGS